MNVSTWELNSSSGEYFRLSSLIPRIQFIYVKKPLSNESGQHHLAKLFCLRVLIHVLWERELEPWAGWDFWGVTNFSFMVAIIQQIFYEISCILGNTMVSFSSLCCVRVDIWSFSWFVKPVILQVCLNVIVSRACEVLDHLRF